MTQQPRRSRSGSRVGDLRAPTAPLFENRDIKRALRPRFRSETSGALLPWVERLAIDFLKQLGGDRKLAHGAIDLVEIEADW